MLPFINIESLRNRPLSLLTFVLGFGIGACKPAETEDFSSLFLSCNESDISFKVEGQLIPAQQQVLNKKSRYFEKVFSSGMAESRQGIIEIKDCEYGVFQGK